ncbi:hypothetical protein ACTTAI_16380 [Rhodobacter capsulatus]|uniref:hypothetical protein n=1 Tax=Rhodobacter capsulatus TaxID=1061 RepID=UPI004026181D
MTQFAVIDAGGRIVRTGHCVAADVPLQARAGETAIETDGAIGDDTHYFAGGEFRELPPRPSEACVFDVASESWIDPRTEADMAAELAAAQVTAVAAVNAAAEAARSRFVTPGSGQAMVYLEKQAEARAWLAAGEPDDLTGYPHLAAEVGITAPTAYQLATIWLALAGIWLTASARIEPIRLSASAVIETAQTISDITAARDAAVVMLGAIMPAAI